MVTKNINLGQIGDFAEDKTEKIVGLGANILLQKLKSTNVPVNEGTMRTAWFQRPVSNLEKRGW